MSNIYGRLVSAVILFVLIMGIIAPMLISASSTIAVVFGFVLIVIFIPVEWLLLKPFIRKLFS